MITHVSRPQTRRVLMVDDELANPTTAGGRSVRALADELKARGIDVVEAYSCEDGTATVTSDSALHCVLVNWTLGHNDRRSHDQATELLRALRARNATIPVYLMADRRATDVTIEVATLSDEFIWLLEDTATFVGGRISASIERYLQTLLPPFAAALARYDREREYSWAAPGHQGGVAFLKSPVGRVFFDYYGENLFRTDMGIERGALGSLLSHTGPVGESERNAARIFGAHRSYSVLNGTSGSNRAIMSACVGDAEIALCDRNCHKSIEQGLVLTGGIPVFLAPTRNRFGIIGPIPPGQLEPDAIKKSIAANPLAKSAASKRPVYAVVTNCTYDGMCYNAADAEARLAKSVDRIHFDEAWYGYARFNPMYRDRFAMRGDPGDHPGERPHRLRDALDPQAAGGALADLLHPHPRRPERHRSWPVQRGLLHPGEHLPALRPDRLQRRRRGDDGWAGRHRADPGGDRRGDRVPPGRGAGAARSSWPRRTGSSPPGMRRTCATPSRASESPSIRRPPSCWRPSPPAGCCTRVRAGTASRGSRTTGACSIRSSSASYAPA